MCPRRYCTTNRQAAAEQTRARILGAARALLEADGKFADFTIDAVAEQAGVARMTVYYQFGSKRGLLEALFDDLAARSLVDRLRGAFAEPEPLDALSQLVAAFGHFWTADRRIIRRLRALAALDPEFEEGIRARDQRRRDALQLVLRRLIENRTLPVPKRAKNTVNILHALTSFETFDALAGEAHSPGEVIPTVDRLVRLALGIRPK